MDRYLTPKQREFIEKWGKDRNWKPFKMSALYAGEHTTAARLRDRWGYLKPADTSSDNWKEWYFAWTDEAKEGWAALEERAAKRQTGPSADNFRAYHREYQRRVRAVRNSQGD